MPILVKGAGSGGSGVGGYRYQLGNVKDLDYNQTTNVVSIKWKDPDNVLLGGKILSQWQGTLVVEKEGSKPISVDDGKVIYNNTIKNQFASSPLVIDKTDEGGVGGFYYGVFPYTKDYVVNVLDGNIIYCQFPLLDDTSWQDISDAVGNGNGTKWWKVGYTKRLYLGGEFNKYVIARIIGFKHDILKYGQGYTANVTFALEGENGSPIGKYKFSEYNYNYDYWINSLIRTEYLPKVLNAFPSDLLENVKTVNKRYTNLIKYSDSDVSSYPDLVGGDNGKIFIPSFTEVFGENGWAQLVGKVEAEGKQYEYYKNVLQSGFNYGEGQNALYNKEQFYTRTIGSGRTDTSSTGTKYYEYVYYFYGTNVAYADGTNKDKEKSAYTQDKRSERGIIPIFCI